MVVAVSFEARGIKTLIRDLVKIEETAVRPLSALQFATAARILAAPRRFDKDQFVILSVKEHKDISIQQLIFGRLFTRVRKFATLKQMQRAVRVRRRGLGGTLPLMDTQRLWVSLWSVTSDDFFIDIQPRSLTSGTKVPYADKHIKGGRAKFQFGEVEQARFRERVKKPSRGQRSRTQEQKNQGRPYYYLFKGWKKSYPRTAAVPKRNFLRPYPPEIIDIVTQRIEAFLRKQLGGD